MGGRGWEWGVGGPTTQSHRSPLSHRDRKKKRFVGQTGQEGKKKVRTESGRYISSSYKNNLYPACGHWWGVGLDPLAAVRHCALLLGIHPGMAASWGGRLARHSVGSSNGESGDGESQHVPLTHPGPAMKSGSRSTR